VIWLRNLCFGILENWLEETRGGRLQEVVTTRHLTVYNYYRAMFFNNAKTHGQKGANVKYIFEQRKLRRFASDLMQMFVHVYLDLTLGWYSCNICSNSVNCYLRFLMSKVNSWLPHQHIGCWIGKVLLLYCSCAGFVVSHHRTGQEQKNWNPVVQCAITSTFPFSVAHQNITCPIGGQCYALSTKINPCFQLIVE